MLSFYSFHLLLYSNLDLLANLSRPPVILGSFPLHPVSPSNSAQLRPFSVVLVFCSFSFDDGGGDLARVPPYPTLCHDSVDHGCWARTPSYRLFEKEKAFAFFFSGFCFPPVFELVFIFPSPHYYGFSRGRPSFSPPFSWCLVTKVTLRDSSRLLAGVLVDLPLDQNAFSF